MKFKTIREHKDVHLPLKIFEMFNWWLWNKLQQHKIVNDIKHNMWSGRTFRTNERCPTVNVYSIPSQEKGTYDLKRNTKIYSFAKNFRKWFKEYPHNRSVKTASSITQPCMGSANKMAPGLSEDILSAEHESGSRFIKINQIYFKSP